MIFSTRKHLITKGLSYQIQVLLANCLSIQAEVWRRM